MSTGARSSPASPTSRRRKSRRRSSQLVANPKWRVPDSIAEKELAKKSQSWLQANNFAMENGQYVQQSGPEELARPRQVRHERQAGDLPPRHAGQGAVRPARPASQPRLRPGRERARSSPTASRPTGGRARPVPEGDGRARTRSSSSSRGRSRCGCSTTPRSGTARGSSSGRTSTAGTTMSRRRSDWFAAPRGCRSAEERRRRAIERLRAPNPSRRPHPPPPRRAVRLAAHFRQPVLRRRVAELGERALRTAAAPCPSPPWRCLATISFGHAGDLADAWLPFLERCRRLRRYRRRSGAWARAP